MERRGLFAVARGVLLAIGCLGACERARPNETVAVSTASAPNGNGASRAAPPPSPPSPPLSVPAAALIPGHRAALPLRERGEIVPAKRYAALSSAACRAESAARRLPVKAARGKTAGMETPLELTGPLAGVRFEVPRGLYGFLDCRLALLLHDMAAHLSAFGVTEVKVNNTYRPGAERAAQSAPAAKPEPAKKGSKNRARQPVKAPEPERLSQHARGLAVDIDEFRFGDGRALNVERDWHGKLGEVPCGPASRVIGDDAAGVALRDLVCSLARAAFCNHLITPSRDAAHANHVHCDIEEGANEIMVE